MGRKRVYIYMVRHIYKGVYRNNCVKTVPCFVRLNTNWDETSVNKYVYINMYTSINLKKMRQKKKMLKHW